MAKQSNKAAANDMQSMFDPQNYQNVFKTWAEMNERVTTMMVEAGQRSVDIAHETANESFSNIRDVAQVREEPSEYSRVYSDFMQKQMELARRTIESFSAVSKQTAFEAAEVAQDAGKTMTDQASENAERATNKAESAAKKAA
ncbi:Phasin protein [Rhodobacteraceae bacterium THAF1]|uniref:phasin family protein n=1 Tax=Palleronia sp. THAF1 TaxID=2587842 RepID=UPI000F3AE5CD|nr:phasin family protein [Palleronia sp. THAF1]QFU09330.1 Phasin protein [Palleronia sp. THAF1]VDC26773.1 Phasin protein [Rhodobacteraceae bacterium THAF1]